MKNHLLTTEKKEIADEKAARQKAITDYKALPTRLGILPLTHLVGFPLMIYSTTRRETSGCQQSHGGRQRAISSIGKQAGCCDIGKGSISPGLRCERHSV